MTEIQNPKPMALKNRYSCVLLGLKLVLFHNLSPGPFGH